MTMTRDEFLKGLETLNAPDQGMNYFGGGFDHDGAQFDERTGQRLMPRHRPASLTLSGDRARFIYRLIEGADDLLSALQSAHPASGAEDVGEYAGLLERLARLKPIPTNPLNRAFGQHVNPDGPEAAKAIHDLLARLTPQNGAVAAPSQQEGGR